MKEFILFLLIAFISTKNLRNLDDDFDWDKVYNELILKHNILRAKHNATALTKLDPIAEFCKDTLEGCINQGTLVHTREAYDGELVGQNLEVSSYPPDADDILSGWYYAEEKYHNYTTGFPPSHFTQVVWKGSKKIGCAYKKGLWKGFPDAYYVCCNYWPTGNVVNYMKENVDKPIE